MSDYIHGGTDAREVERLEKQARFIGPLVLPLFVASPGERVLDLATGVGAMAGELLRRFPGIELFGVDLRASQLSSARRNHPEVRYTQADGSALPFSDGTFDRVHCSWLLEHVRDPVSILREVRRVLRKGGTCQFVEVDNATFGTTPELPRVTELMEKLNQAQLASGGDPYIGRRLGSLFREAGFTEVRESTPLHTRADGSDPAFFRAFLEEFAEILESLDEALGPQMGERLLEAARQLRGIEHLPGAEIRYRGTVVRATR